MSVRASILLGTALAVGATVSARSTPRLAVPPGATLVHVARAREPLKVDGALDEPAWPTQGARVVLTTDGQPAKPYSDVRALVRDDRLYLALYAADEDIRTGDLGHDGPLWTRDAFELVFDGRYAIDVSPLGVTTDARIGPNGQRDFTWESGAVTAHDLDGTRDDPSDDDEEWVIELSIPLANLGHRPLRGERLELTARRCDVPKGAARRCANAHVVLQLD